MTKPRKTKPREAKRVSVGRRIRTIKPEIIEDEIVGRLSHGAWRLFVSMFLLADDYGNMRGAPDRIRGDAFPWDTCDSRESFGKIRETLGELLSAGLIAEYQNAGQSYLTIVGWNKHQRVDHPGVPRVPGPNDAESKETKRLSDQSIENLPETLANLPESLATDRDRDRDRDREEEEQRAREETAFVAQHPPPEPRIEITGEAARAAVTAAFKAQVAAMLRLGLREPLFDGRRKQPIWDRYAEQVEAHVEAGKERHDAEQCAASDLLHAIRVREHRVRTGLEDAAHFNGVSNWSRGSFRFSVDQSLPPETYTERALRLGEDPDVPPPAISPAAEEFWAKFDEEQAAKRRAAEAAS